MEGDGYPCNQTLFKHGNIHHVTYNVQARQIRFSGSLAEKSATAIQEDYWGLSNASTELLETEKPLPEAAQIDQKLIILSLFNN